MPGKNERKSFHSEKEMDIQYLEKKTFRRRVIDYIVITIASVIYGVAVSLFLDPNSLAPGGVTGIAIIFNRLTGMETGTWMLIMNIPILALGTWKFGIRFILTTMYCTALTSVMTNLFGVFEPVTDDPLLAALAGGTLVAVALGLVFKTGSTTGGTDIIVKLLRLKFPHLRTGGLFLLTDAIIVSASAVVFRDMDKALYAGVAVVVTSLMLDVVLYGREGAKLLYIISDASEQITGRLLDELDIGVTNIQGFGAYSGKEKNVILCAVRKQTSPKVEEIVKEEDAQAFMIVTSAAEVYGEGHKSYFSEKI